MVEGILKCVVGNKQNSPLVSGKLLSKTCDVDHCEPLMLSHKNTIFPCQGQQHMMGERRLEWIEQCKTCNMEKVMENFIIIIYS